jgi:hypothetical protein
MPIRCVACLEKSSATIGTKKLVESGKADTDPPTAAAPRELSANFYGKAALREAVTAKKRFTHMPSHSTKYPFIITTLGRINDATSIRRREISCSAHLVDAR